MVYLFVQDPIGFFCKQEFRKYFNQFSQSGPEIYHYNHLEIKSLFSLGSLTKLTKQFPKLSFEKNSIVLSYLYPHGKIPSSQVLALGGDAIFQFTLTCGM